MTSKSVERRLALQATRTPEAEAGHRVWTLYKAPDLNALAIGLETCELGNWTVFQVLTDPYGKYTILACKVLA